MTHCGIGFLHSMERRLKISCHQAGLLSSTNEALKCVNCLLDPDHNCLLLELRWCNNQSKVMAVIDKRGDGFA